LLNVDYNDLGSLEGLGGPGALRELYAYRCDLAPEALTDLTGLAAFQI
jgi:hypothetical protein